MIPRLRLLFLTPLATLLACSSHAILPIPTTAAVSGDYVLNVNPALGSSATSFTGNLFISASNVEGAFQYNNGDSACNGQSFPVIGTIASNGLMTLSSSSFAGSFSGNTATLAMQTPLDIISGEVPNSSGSAQITAGTGTNCALPSSTLTANYIAPYSGTWVGTAGSGNTTGTVTLIVSEAIPGVAPEPPSQATTTAGLIPVNATLAFGGTCSFTSTIGMTGQISGYNLQLSQISSGPPVTVVVNNAQTVVSFSMTVPIGALNAAGNGPLSSGAPSCLTNSYSYSGSVHPQ
jgi:hypothetical protein